MAREHGGRFPWRRFWCVLLLYWSALLVGPLTILRSYASLVAPFWILVFSLLTTIACMIYDHGGWNIWKKTGYVAISGIVQAALINPLYLLILHIPVIRRSLILLCSCFILAGLPFVVYAMNRAGLFAGRNGASGSHPPDA